jgi:predicted phosphoribosyltransferase
MRWLIPRYDAIDQLSRRHESKLHDNPKLRGKTGVFDDRAHAGGTLAEMLQADISGEQLVLAIPAGGVPVGVSLAQRLGLAIDLAVVSKITLPGNSEVGCGAVAFDGTVELNEDLLRSTGLTGRALQERIDATHEKVRRREESLRPDRPRESVEGRGVILVDDGLASGFTMRVAVEAVEHLNPASISIAVPTAPLRAVAGQIGSVDAIWCANIRSAPRFAVASAYRRWRDVPEEEVARLLRGE